MVDHESAPGGGEIVDLPARELRRLLDRLEALWPSLDREDALGAALVIRGLAARSSARARGVAPREESVRAAGLAPAPSAR